MKSAYASRDRSAPTTSNTRAKLRQLFARGTVGEESFQYLDDCRSLQRWKSLNFLELLLWKILTKLGLHYPEVCLLAVYRREPVRASAKAPARPAATNFGDRAAKDL